MRAAFARAAITRPAALLTALFTLLVVLVAPGSVAEAQDRVEVEGTADFRNPPTLGPGAYSDRMVSGESIWYGVLYTNNEDFRFAVSFAEPAAAADSDLTLEIALIGPTLGQAGSADPVIIGSASYDGGETNLWYLEVRLESDGVLGLEYEIHIDVEGVEENKINDCTETPECTLDVELEGVNAEIVELEEDIGELENAESPDVVQGDIDELRVDLQDAENQASTQRDEIALLCAPETDCTELPELDPVTPGWALALGGLLLLVGLGALGAKLLRKG